MLKRVLVSFGKKSYHTNFNSFCGNSNYLLQTQACLWLGRKTSINREYHLFSEWINSHTAETNRTLSAIILQFKKFPKSKYQWASFNFVKFGWPRNLPNNVMQALNLGRSWYMSSLYLENVQQILLNQKGGREPIQREKPKVKLYGQECPRQMIQLQNEGYKSKYGEGRQHCVIRWLASKNYREKPHIANSEGLDYTLLDPEINIYVPNSISHFFLHIFLYFCSFRIKYLIYPSGWVDCNIISMTVQDP